MNKRGHGFFRIILALLSLGTQITKEQPFPDTEGFTHNGIHDVTLSQNTSSSKTVQTDDGYYLDLLNGICREGWVKGRVNDVTICLRTNADPMSWEDARDTCRNEFSFLMKMEAPVTIESKDMGDFLKEKNIDKIWTGLHEEGGFLVWDEIAPHKVRAYNDPLEEELLRRRLWNWNIEPYVNDDIDDFDDFEFQEEESHSACGSLNFNRHYGEHVISKRAVNRNIKNAKLLQMDDVFESDHTPSPTSREIDNSPDPTNARPQKPQQMNLLQFMQHLKQLAKLNTRRRLGTIHSANDNKKYVNSQRVRMAEKKENDHEFTTNLNEAIEPVNPTEETDFFNRRKKTTNLKRPPKTPPKLFPSPFDNFTDDNSTTKGNASENFTKFDQDIDNSTSESGVILPFQAFSTQDKAHEKTDAYADDYVNYDDLILNDSKKKSTQVSVLKPTPSTPYKKIKPVPTPPTTRHGKRLKMIKPPPPVKKMIKPPPQVKKMIKPPPPFKKILKPPLPVKKIIKPPPVQLETQTKSKNVTMESLSDSSEERIKNPIGIAKTLVRKNVGKSKSLSKAEKAKRITDSLAVSSEDISKEDSDEIDDLSSDQNTTSSFGNLTIQNKDDGNVKRIDKLPITLDIPPLIDIKKPQSKEASKDSSRLSDEGKQRQSETDEVVSRTGIESESEERVKVDSKNNKNERVDEDKKKTAKPVPISLGSEESEDVKAYLKALQASLKKFKEKAQKEATAVSSKKKDVQTKNTVKSSTLFNTRTDYDLTESDSLLTNTKLTDQSKKVDERKTTEKAKEPREEKSNEKRINKQKGKPIIDKTLILDIPPPPPPIMSTRGKKENKNKIEKQRTQKENQETKEDKKKTLPKTNSKGRGLAIQLKTTGDIDDSYVKDYINALKAARKQNPLTITTKSKNTPKPVRKHAKINSGTASKKVPNNETIKKPKVTSESTDRSKSSSSYSGKESSVSDSLSSENFSLDDEEAHRIRDTENKRKGLNDNKSPPLIDVKNNHNIKEDKPERATVGQSSDLSVSIKEDDSDIEEETSDKSEENRNDEIEIKTLDSLQDSTEDRQRNNSIKINEKEKSKHSTASVQEEPPQIPTVESESKETDDPDSEEIENSKDKELESDDSESKPFSTDENEEKLKNETSSITLNRKINLKSEKVMKKTKGQRKTDLPTVINTNVPSVKKDIKKTINNDDKSEEESEEKENEGLPKAQLILTTTTQSMLSKKGDIELPKSINKKAGGIVIPTQSNIIFGSMTENPKEKEREGQEAPPKDSDKITTESVNNKELIKSDDKSVPVTKSQRIAKINLKNVKSISNEESKETEKANSDNKIQTTISSLESSSSSASSEIMHTSSMQSDDADDSSLFTENKESEPDDEPGKLVIDMTDKNKTDSYSSDEESVETTSSESVTLTTGVDEYETTTSFEDNAIKKPEATLSLPSTLYGITKDKQPSSDLKTTTKQGSKTGIDKSSEKVSVDQLSVESLESDEIVESFKKQFSPSNKENKPQINSDSEKKQSETIQNITDKSNKDPMRDEINIEKSKSSEENSKEDESKEIVTTSTPVNILTTNGVVDTDEAESSEEKEVYPSTTSLPFIEVINDGSGENSVIFGIKDSRKNAVDVLSAKSEDENNNSSKSIETKNEIIENTEDKNDIENKLKESEESSEEHSYNSSVTSKFDERKDIEISAKDVSNSKESFTSSGKEKDESIMTQATDEKKIIVSKEDDTSTSHEKNVKDLTEVKNKLKTSAEFLGEKSNNSEDKSSSDERKDIENEREESNVTIASGEKKGIVSTDDEASNSSEENVNDEKDITNEMKKSTKSLEEKSDNLPAKSSSDERKDIENSKEDAFNSQESFESSGEEKGESNMMMTSNEGKDIVSNDDEASTSSESDDSSIATKIEVSSKYVPDTTTGIENLVNDNSISKESIASEKNKNDTLDKSPISEESKDSSEIKSENISTILSSQTSREDSNVSLEKLPNNVVNDNANEQIDMNISEESEEFSKVKSDNDSEMHKSDEKENSEKLREDARLSKSLATSEENSNDNSAKLASFEESNYDNIHIKSNISIESTESSYDGKDSISISSDELNALNKTSKEIRSNSKEPENFNDSKEDIPLSGAEEIVGNLNTDDSISKETTEKNEDDSDENTIVENKTIYNETIGSIESNEIATEKFNDTFFDAVLVNNTRSSEISSSEAAEEESNNKKEEDHIRSSADLEDIIENLSKDSSSSNESAEKSDEDNIPALLSTHALKSKTLGLKPKNTTESMESSHDSSSPEDDDIDPTYLRSSDENKLIKSGSYEIKDYYAEHFKNFDEPKDDEAMYMKEVHRDKMERDKNYERDISQEIPIVLEAIRNIDDSQEQTTGFQSDEAFRSLFERLSNKTRDLLAEAASKDEVRHREDQDLDLGGIRGEISDDLDMDPEDILAQEADLRAEANVKGALLPSYSKPLTITRKIDTSKANMKLSNCNVRRKSMCFTYPVTVESTASSCDSGWVGHVFHRKCYRIMRNANTIPKMQYKNAKNICEMEGGDVAHMTDGYGGRFLIMTLLKSIKEHMKELPPKDNIPPVWVNSPNSAPSCHVMTTSGPITMGCNQSIAVTICEKSANAIGVQSTGVFHSSLEIMEFTLSDKKKLRCDLKNSAAELPILWFKDGRLIDIKVKKRKESILPHLGGRPISSLPEPAETPVTDLELNTWLRKTLQTSTEHPVSEEVFQGNYWCEGWKSRPFIREKSAEIFVRFKDVITFVGRVRIPAIPYDERLLHNKIEKNLPPIMNIMTDLRFINEIVFRKLQQEFPNLESISAYPGDISSKPPLQLSYNIYIRASKNYTIADEIPLFKSLRSRYQEILMDGNILTRLPRGTPIRFIRSIRIRSTVSCQQTELRDPRTRLVANFFPAGIKLNVSSIEVCENGEKAGKATCKGDFRSGAYWGNIQIKQGCGISEPQIEEDTHDDSNDLTDSEEAVEEYENLVEKMTPEERLKELAEMDIEENNLESIIEETAEITDTVEEIKENDLEYINEIMEKSAESEGKTKFVALKAIQTVNRLLTMDDTVFEKAQRVSSIIKNFEKIVEDTELSDDGYFRLVLPNVAMEIYELEKHNKPVIGMAAKTDEYGNVMYTPFNQKRIVTIYNDSAFYEDVDVAIHLPPELVHDTKAENKSRLYMMVYRDGNMFQDSSVPITVAQAPQVIKSHDLKKLNSFVISASIGGKKIEGLQQKVKTIFRPLKDPAGRTRTCAFYNFTMNNNAGGWSSAGCEYGGQVNGRDICLCDHLTNFAVLVDFYGQEDRIERVHEISLSIISLIGLSLSIIGLSLTIISFVFFRKLRKGRAQQTLFNLALSMLCSWVIFLVGIKQTYHYIGCLIVAVLLHYFILASFMWMLMEAFLQYLTFVKVLGTYVTRYTLKSVIAAWGLPLIPIICILSIDFNLYKGGDHYCWMSLDAFYYGFALPIGLIILANLIVFVITVVSIFRRPQGLRSNQSKHKMAITNLQAAITSFVLLGLSWILGYFAISDARLPFQYAFTILNSLQGFFIFVLFVARKKQVREQWKMICCCIFPDQQKAQRTLSASASYPSTCSSRSTSSTSTLHHGRTERSDSCKTTTSFIGSEYDSIYTVPYARSSRESLYYRKL